MSNIGSQAWLAWLCRGWLVAGTLDILYATGFSYWRGTAPTRVLQFVASGALGPASFQGGLATAAAGLAFHYLNALLITAAFFALCAVVPSLARAPFVIGPAYGVLAYLVMNYVVIPLSRIGPRPTPAAIVWVTGVLVHMFFIGLPIALSARRGFGPAPA